MKTGTKVALLAGSLAISALALYLLSRGRQKPESNTSKKQTPSRDEAGDNVLKNLIKKPNPAPRKNLQISTDGLDILKSHSIERLRKLIRILKPEYCAIYARVAHQYKEILKIPEKREVAIQQINDAILKKTVQIFTEEWDDRSLTLSVFEKWLNHFQDDPIVFDFRVTTASLSKDFAEKGTLKRLDIDFSGELPQTLNAETTLKLYRLQFRLIRYDIYNEMKKANQDMSEFPEDEFQKIYSEVAKRFDQIRVKVFRSMFGDPLTDEQFAREFQLKAYCTYGETLIEGQSLIQLVQ